MSGGRVFGLEALIRWNHPKEGFLAPGAFLSIAEERGLIVALSEVVVERSIMDISCWRAEGLPVPRISINVHQDQINDRIRSTMPIIFIGWSKAIVKRTSIRAA